MKVAAYLQYEGGEEPLEVTVPDPNDGTWVIVLPKSCPDGWVRVCFEDDDMPVEEGLYPYRP